jgi:membrane protein required for colicin V production
MMNLFDAVVYAVAIVAIVLGFRAGLLRSLATILGYLIAAPIAVAITPRVTAFALSRSALPPDQQWLVLFAVFIVVGVGISALMWIAVSGVIDPEFGLFDRVAGAVLGAVRIFLVAVLVVVIFDRIIPADRQPGFLIGSRLRPYLSAAGKKGLQSLPPEVEDYIDRLKRERGL